MILRIATLNLEQDHKCWVARRHQVTELRAWIRTRDDAEFSVVCGSFNAKARPLRSNQDEHPEGGVLTSKQ
jgi:hypothetical protein